MKTPDEIKKGLECCAQDKPYPCNGCPYERTLEEEWRCKLDVDALALIQQLEEREWQLFDLLSSTQFTKACYFKQEDGTVYSRVSGKYMTFEQAIDEFAHELTDGAQVPKWISVEERLPEDDANYLVFTSDANKVELAIYYGDGEWLAPDLGNLTRVVTHYMPLPEPPKEG